MEEGLSKKEGQVGNKKVITTILMVIIIVVIGVFVYFSYLKNDQDESNPTNNNQASENTFKYSKDGSYGTAYVTGYASVAKDYYCEKMVDECNETTADEINDVVYFYVTSTESEDLRKELNEWYGEQSDDSQILQLGCVNDNVISYIAYVEDIYNTSGVSPEYHGKMISMSQEDSNKIISSNESNQITLKLEKTKYSVDLTSYYNACLSPMTKVEVVD